MTNRNGDAELVEPVNPRAAGRSFVRRELDIARVALCLAEPAGNIFYAALRLDDADTAAFDEKRIVHRAASVGHSAIAIACPGSGRVPAAWRSFALSTIQPADRN